MFYVLSGDLTGHCAGQRWSASPGVFVLLPRDTEHGFTVTSRCEVKALVVVAPPRLDAHVAQRHPILLSRHRVQLDNRRINHKPHPNG